MGFGTLYIRDLTKYKTAIKLKNRYCELVDSGA